MSVSSADAGVTQPSRQAVTHRSLCVTNTNANGLKMSAGVYIIIVHSTIINAHSTGSTCKSRVCPHTFPECIGGESFRNADVEAAALSSITPLIIARPWPQHLADRNYNFTPAAWPQQAVTRREICQISPRQYFTSLFHRAKCRTCAKIYHCYCCS